MCSSPSSAVPLAIRIAGDVPRNAAIQSGIFGQMAPPPRNAPSLSTTLNCGSEEEELVAS